MTLKHNHDNHHSHSHHHTNATQLKRALLLTLIFMVIEFAGGIYTRSLALTSDAVHMLTDAAALGLSLLASFLAHRKNHKKIETWAAFINGAFLFVLSIMIIVEGFERLKSPVEIKPAETLIIAALGLLFNLGSVFFLLKADQENLNIKAALFHVFGDILGSIGAIVAAAITLFSGSTMADPIVSLLIGLLISISALALVKDTLSELF